MDPHEQKALREAVTALFEHTEALEDQIRKLQDPQSSVGDLGMANSLPFTGNSYRRKVREALKDAGLP